MSCARSAWAARRRCSSSTASRIDTDPSAERFALKVPDYNATAARSVSQEEFFKLFREEASALIMLPNHANLARFVTFNLAARPLPSS